jgi:CheY-like chemotaxis protein
MTFKRILVVENDSAVLALLAGVIRQIETCMVKECSYAAAALELADKEHLDVIFVDQKLQHFSSPQDVFYEGAHLVSRLRTILPDALLIAYSSDLTDDNESDGLVKKFRGAGAHEVLSRRTLVSMPAHELGNLIDVWMAKHQVTRPRREVLVDERLATKAAIETIGDQNLNRILSELCPNSARDHLAAITGGLSGAFVFRLHSHTGDSVDHTILKVAPEGQALRDEVRKAPAVGSMFGSLAPQSIRRLSRNVNGWSGTLFGEITEAVPLAQFLALPDMTPPVQDAIHDLVRDVYLTPAKGASRRTSIDSDAYALSWRAGAALERVLLGLQSMTSLLSARDRHEADIVWAYLQEVLAGRSALLGGYGHLANLHGDLHAGNVFIREGRRSWVIDFERHGAYPRLLDIACLHVDILLARWDAGEGVDWQFDNVDKWERQAVSVFPFGNGASPGAHGKHERMMACIRCLADGAAGLPGVTRAEYAYALMFQLARYLKFDSITIPKRVLAIRLFVRLMGICGVDPTKA